jgi:hypothetical protein
MISLTIKHLPLSLQRWGCTNPVFRSVDPQHPSTSGPEKGAASPLFNWHRTQDIGKFPYGAKEDETGKSIR